MKSKREAVVVVGIVVLSMVGFLLSKPTHASTPTAATQVQVVNKPTVTVGNTPTVTIGNTPSVTIGNTPSVNVANKVAISALPAIVSDADLYPIQVGDGCTFPVGSTQCTVDGLYAVPDGFYAVLTDLNGFCFTYPVQVGTAQLLVQWNGSPQTINLPIQQAPVSNALINPATFGFSGAKYKASAGTSITAQVTDASSPPDGANCAYLLSGYLVPITPSQASASLPGSGTLKSPGRR